MLGKRLSESMSGIGDDLIADAMEYRAEKKRNVWLQVAAAAAVVALVDAVPVLGTGTVLLPWALFSLLQRQHLRSIGLLLTYAAAFLTRTILEPKLVGRHIGLDPLLTLIFLYLGYRFWGIFGMLLAPMLAAAAKAAAQPVAD